MRRSTLDVSGDSALQKTKKVSFVLQPHPQPSYFLSVDAMWPAVSSCHHEFPSLERTHPQTVSQNKSFLPRVAFASSFYHSTNKRTQCRCYRLNFLFHCSLISSTLHLFSWSNMIDTHIPDSGKQNPPCFPLKTVWQFHMSLLHISMSHSLVTYLYQTRTIRKYPLGNCVPG